MSSSYYTQFKKYAQEVKGWNTLSKSELLNLYLENENNPKTKDNIMSAIICRYWNLISIYQNHNKAVLTREDCYDWLINSILRTIRRRDWKNPNYKIYYDVNGPDKSVNQCMFSEERIFYTYSNTQKRKGNYTSSSIQQLEEDNLSYVLPSENPEEDNLTTLYIKDTVKKCCKEDKYIQGLIVDSIIHGDVFEYDKSSHTTEFSKKKVLKHLRRLDGTYCVSFSKFYSVDIEKLKESIQICKKIQSSKLYKLIDQILFKMKKEYI